MNENKSRFQVKWIFIAALFFSYIIYCCCFAFLCLVNYTRMKLNATETLDVNYFIASVARQQTMGFIERCSFLYYCNFFYFNTNGLARFFHSIWCGEKDDSKFKITYSILVLWIERKRSNKLCFGRQKRLFMEQYGEWDNLISLITSFFY